MIGYLVFQGLLIGVYALFSLGLNLQWGYTGLLNFGHVAFMTVGAYTTVLLSLQGLANGIAVVGGMLAAAGLGLIWGLTTLRLRQDYLAIVTLGTAEVIRLGVTNEAQLTGGTQGLQAFSVPLQTWHPNLGFRLGMIGGLTILTILVYTQLWRWFAQGFSRHQGINPVIRLGVAFILGGIGLILYYAEAYALYYYNVVPGYRRSGLLLLLLGVLVFSYWGMEQLGRSPWGRVLKGIREDPEVVTALGKNVWSYQIQALMLGGAIAGLAGAFYAWQFASLFPDSFKPQVTFDAWTIVVLGGAANNLGTLGGAVIFWVYDSLTRFGFAALALDDTRISALRVMTIGFFLIGLMRWRPQGFLNK